MHAAAGRCLCDVLRVNGCRPRAAHAGPSRSVWPGTGQDKTAGNATRQGRLLFPFSGCSVCLSRRLGHTAQAQRYLQCRGVGCGESAAPAPAPAQPPRAWNRPQLARLPAPRIAVSFSRRACICTPCRPACTAIALLHGESALGQRAESCCCCCCCCWRAASESRAKKGTTVLPTEHSVRSLTGSLPLDLTLWTRVSRTGNYLIDTPYVRTCTP